MSLIAQLLTALSGVFIAGVVAAFFLEGLVV